MAYCPKLIGVVGWTEALYWLGYSGVSVCFLHHHIQTLLKIWCRALLSSILFVLHGMITCVFKQIAEGYSLLVRLFNLITSEDILFLSLWITFARTNGVSLPELFCESLAQGIVFEDFFSMIITEDSILLKTSWFGVDFALTIRAGWLSANACLCAVLDVMARFIAAMLCSCWIWAIWFAAVA